MENVTSSGTAAISQRQLELDLKRAAALDAGRAIFACADQTNTAQAKKACILSDEVREALANATGKLESEISDGELRRYAEEYKKRIAAQLMKACKEMTGAPAKRMCLNDAQEQIRKLTGETMRTVRAKAEQWAREGAGDEALELLRSCTPPTSSECKQEAKQALARSLGRSGAADVSGFELDRFVRGATTRRIKQLMQTCMEEAGDNSTDQEMSTCKAEAREALKEAVGLVTEADFLKELDRVAEEQAREVFKTCGDDQAACRAELRRALAQSSGRRPEDLTESDVKKFQRRGAMQEGKDHLLACIRAAKEAGEDAQDCLGASVDEVKAMGQAVGARAKKLQRDLGMMLQESHREECAKQATEQEAEACLEAGTADLDDAMLLLLKDVPAAAREKRKKALQKSADVNIAGKEYVACRKAASTQQEKEACTAQVTTLLGKTDIVENAGAVLDRFRAKQLAQLATDCTGTPAECRREARAMAEEELGFKPRKFAVMKRLGVLKELAEGYAVCLEDQASVSECETEAQTLYTELTGGDASSFQELKAKVVKLAEAIQEGMLTRIVPRKEIEVEVGTSGSVCDSQIGQAMLDKLEDERSQSTLLDAMTNFTERPCRLLAGVPFYLVLVPTPDTDDADIEAEAERIALSFESAVLGSTPTPRRLGAGRRLSESVSEVNSAQGVDEEVVTDAPTPSPSSPTPSLGPGGNSRSVDTTTSGTGRYGAPLLSIAMLLLAAGTGFA